MLQSRSGNALFAALFAVALLPTFAACLWGWGELQRRFLPVIEDFYVAKVGLDEDGALVLGGSFHKVFEDYVCEPRALRWRAYDRVGRVYRIRASYPDGQGFEPENNRPKGPQGFRGWTLHVEDYPLATVLVGRAHHRCLWFVPFVSEFPPLDYGDYIPRVDP